MNISGIAQTLETINIRPDEIHDEELSKAFRLLLQLIEELSEYVEKMRAENQRLRDEISLMKGEQPKQTLSPHESDRVKISLQKMREKPKTLQKIRSRKQKSPK